MQHRYAEKCAATAAAVALTVTGCANSEPEAVPCIGYSVESRSYEGSPNANKGLVITVPALGENALGYVVGFREPGHKTWADSNLIGASSASQSSIVLMIKGGDVQFRVGEAYDKTTHQPSQAHTGEAEPTVAFSADTTEELPPWEIISETGIKPGWGKIWYEVEPC